MEPIYTAQCYMTEKQQRYAVRNTRNRARYKEYLILLIISLTCIVLCFCGYRNAVVGVVLGAMRIFQSEKRVRSIVEERIDFCNLFYGRADTSNTVNFYENSVECINHYNKDKAFKSEYGEYEKIYVKADYLFLCDKKVRGIYVTFEGNDKERIISILKEKCPQAQWCK